LCKTRWRLGKLWCNLVIEFDADDDDDDDAAK
jgi:hypothetical protein